MANVAFRAMRKGALSPVLKIRVITRSGSAINFSVSSGRTNTVYIRNQTTGQWVRQDSATGVTGGSDSTLQVQWTTGDTDFTGPIAVFFQSTDSSGNKSYYPPDGNLISTILPLGITSADREALP